MYSGIYYFQRLDSHCGCRVVPLSFSPMNRFLCWCALILIGVLGLLTPAIADDAPTAPAASTTPTTAPTTRHVLEIPPGFHVITVAGRSIVCQPVDDDWIRHAVLSLAAATRPTTMPSDLIPQLQQKRDGLVAEIMHDFVLSDPKPLNDELDQAVATLQRLQTAKVPVYYFPVSYKKVVQLMQNGWRDPRYQYIRFSGEVVYDPNVPLTFNRPMDDMLMCVLIDDDATLAAKNTLLTSTIQDFESRYLNEVSAASQSCIATVMDDFLNRTVLTPLRLPPSEQWFSSSVAITYCIKYSTEITGASRNAIMDSSLRGNSLNPLAWRPLDLTNPIDPSILRPDTAPLYREAMLHKGLFVIDTWISQAGDGAITKLLPALRTSPPATPADLIQAIKSTTGVDLTSAMQPDYSQPK